MIDNNDAQKTTKMRSKYGNRPLKLVDVQLQGYIRKSDTTGRVGNNEFIAIIHNSTTGKQVKAAAEKIKNIQIHPSPIGNTQASVAGSAEIALSPNNTKETKQLYQLADLTMYLAKHNGWSSYHLYSSSTKSGPEITINNGNESKRDP
ncbi:MAG: GGDEF domain-containing protein [Gammaproteobacteria bacterium]|nr:GGDEF domain-containing protein [Gammaproteobacteria bacterium]